MKTCSTLFAGLVFFTGLVTTPALAAEGSSQTADPRKPNIIFFLVDDLGWSDIGCYGSRFYDTPHIDALAGEGVRFTDAYATCHVCSPSRASIMTGKYPARLKLTDWLGGREDYSFQRLKNALIHQALPLNELTLAEVLRQHGYRTGHFGKWHLGEAPAGPLQQGFDVQVPRNWCKGWPKRGYHAPFELEGLSDKKGDYLTDRLTDEALKFIDENSSKPFFLYLSHFAVHDPIEGRADLVKKYEKKKTLLPPEDRPYILEGNPDSKTTFTPAQLDQMIREDAYALYRVLPNQMVKIKQRQDNPQFAAMVESVDESLGRIVAKLKALGLTEDTIIVFTSDNGGMSAANFGNPDHVIPAADLDEYYSTSNLPLRGAKGWLYEGGIRVPLIIKWPGQGKVGSICREPVTGVDYYPTILDMVGIPAVPVQHVDGQSLVPLFQGATSLSRDALYWHFPHYSNHGMQSPGGAIRCGQYKLLEYFENGTVQLFDLEVDLEEQNDLSQRHPEIAGQLLKKLRQWRKKVDAEIMGPNPGFDVNATVEHSNADIADMSEAIETFAPGWSIKHCGIDDDIPPGIRNLGLSGQVDWLVTHPLSEEVGCVLFKQIEVPAGKTQVCLTVGHHRQGDWVLVVKADGDELLRTTVGSETTVNHTRDIQVDLSQYAGSEILLELVNEANGWSYEAAYWGKIAIDEKRSRTHTVR